MQILSYLFLPLYLLIIFPSFTMAANKTNASNSKISALTDSPSVLSGGGATVFASGRNAFSLPSGNMPLMQKLDFSVGNSFFRNPWVTAPASTDARDGLGPLFNTNGCQNCHIKDGRGHAPNGPEDSAVSLLVRLSIPENNLLAKAIQQSVLPEPNYGDQLQDFAIAGVKPEGRIHIEYTPVKKILAGGETVTLRKPIVSIVDLAYGKLHPQVQMSARIASPMIGLGLLEAIAEKDILELADPSDNDGDGISGKANLVWDVSRQSLALGRFGWKAGQPSVRQQNAAAFDGDLGITSSLFSKDHCTEKQVKCLNSTSGGQPELSDKILDLVSFYARNLAVPARRNYASADVQQGEKLFREIGCGGCHQPQWKTSANYSSAWLSDQTIHPYTDLLLHDMGPGLADNRPEFLANGQEWRTPPLWGIGLTKTVNTEASFLHDGRARDLKEAILWHGGEAEKSQKAFSLLPFEQRSMLIDFLNSL
jgi:CxxC motif-containing protein (DUF1111 family)